jgi:hypothetical protein
MSMMKRAIRSVLLCGGMLAATQVVAQQSCSRADLQTAAESYVAAQTAGQPQAMTLASQVAYQEQMAPADMAKGILAKPLKVDFHRNLTDPATCQSFTEMVVADPAHPYVIGTRLKIADGKVIEIETLVTDKDDWLFNAGNTMKYSRAEKWDVIPAASRDSRATIIAAADAYLDLFNDKNAKVPWGTPCARLEGGIYTTKNAPGVVTAKDSCNVGVPSNTPLINRRYIVDEELGSVVVLLNFGKNQQPDSHMFRVENGKLRYVHTITVCRTLNCGFPVKPIPDAPSD